MRKRLRLLLFLLIEVSVNAQNLDSGEQTISTLPNIVPPSPTAFALGNYGNVPVGLFTGSLNLQIPITEFKSGNINVPIYLFYGSNGIKVDDVSGNIGIGWNVNFGGVITKTIRDLDDDEAYNVPIPENLNGYTVNSSIANAFYEEGGNALADTEKDLYTFSFNGHSGKFVFDKNDKPILYSQENLIIKRENPIGFSITTQDGTKYFFSDQEKTSFRTMGDGFTNPGQLRPTAWYLSKIANTLGDEIYFSYDNGGANYEVSKSQTFKIYTPSPQNSCSGFLSGSPIFGNVLSQQMTINGKKINKISSKNETDGEVIFQYGSNIDPEGYSKMSSILRKNKNLQLIDKIDFTYEITSNNRTFLKKISFNDSTKNYAFEYINQELLPKRLEYGQDHWGYFNGKQNPEKLIPNNLEGYGLEDLYYEGADKEPDSNYAQIGLLRKITYPTKGYTNIYYEGNDYWGSKTIHPSLKEHHLSIKTQQNGQNSDQFTVSVKSDHWLKISGRSFFNIDCDEIQNTGHNSSILTVYDEDNFEVPLWVYSTNFSQYTFAQSNLFLEDGQDYYIEAKAGKNYTIKLRTVSKCTTAFCDIYYKDDPTITYNTNIPTGGVRVQYTEDYDLNGSSNFKRYYYTKRDDSSQSSGDSGVKPIYYDLLTSRTYCPPTGDANPMTFIDNTFLLVNSSSIISLFNSGNSNCYYSEVTTSFGGNNFEKGGEYKQYYLIRDEAGEKIFGNSTILSAPWTNYSWNNGLEKLSVLFDSSKTTVKEVLLNYDVKENFTNELKSYSFRNNYEVNITGGILHNCTAYEVSNYPLNICYNQPVGKQVWLRDITNLDVMEYKNKSYWHYLKSQKTTDYINGTPLLTTTEYFYDNPSHYQLTSQKTIFPDNSRHETTYQYAHDKNKTKLIEANMVGIPLETTMVKKQNTSDPGKTISKTYTDYPDTLPDTQTGNLLLPKSFSALDLFTGGMSTEVTYNQYDNKGNIQQYTKDGTPTAIVWGYNQTQPIAKIEGATYAQVSSLASAIISASDTDALAGVNNDESSLLGVMKTFRDSLPNYQVTTYTYDPLVGVRSITPPNGIRQVYIYDDANRLNEVRENSQSGNLLKEYQYNYKH